MHLWIRSLFDKNYDDNSEQVLCIIEKEIPFKIKKEKEKLYIIRTILWWEKL